MNKCSCEEIKKFAKDKGTTVMIAAGVGMASGIAVGFLIKSCMEKEQPCGKKIINIGIAALREFLSGISENM